MTMAPATRFTTPVVKRSLNPAFPPESSTFDYPIYLSLAAVIGGRGLEGVMWDKVRRWPGVLTDRTSCARSTWASSTSAPSAGLTATTCACGKTTSP